MDEEVRSGAEPRVFVTDAEVPGRGRTFVWSKIGWFERLKGEPENVEFSHVADSEDELRGWLAQSDGDIDLTELDDGFAEIVREEFLEDTPLYPEAPELSEELPLDDHGE